MVISKHIWIYVGLYICAIFAFSSAIAQTPYTGDDVHLGVTGCYGSTCHSRQEATGVIVRQNEILTWQDETSPAGAHARAFKTLKTKRSQDIADKLGIGPAQKAKACLSCHADGISNARKGPKFQIADGIGCEACHGGAGDWLPEHYAIGASHSKNLDLGLYALENPNTRGKVCLSCHLGSSAEDQFVTHRIMAAGHPRIAFELDLFTELQRHHDDDIDYRNRKTVAAGIRVWAEGQAITAKEQIRLFMDSKTGQDGLFPELVFFDCLACHRPISDDPSWRPKAKDNPGRPQQPGQVRFNDANMIMLLAVAEELSPELGAKLSADIKNFHYAIGFDAAKKVSAATDLSATIDQISELVTRKNYSKNVTLNILNRVVERALTRRYTDYVGAEQAVMAIDTLLSSMIGEDQISAYSVANMHADLDKAYEAVDKPNAYDQAALISALSQLQTRFKALR